MSTTYKLGILPGPELDPLLGDEGVPLLPVGVSGLVVVGAAFVVQRDLAGDLVRVLLLKKICYEHNCTVVDT